jgi:hypothetical protein
MYDDITSRLNFENVSYELGHDFMQQLALLLRQMG